MAGKFLIDVTDARFMIPANASVIEFIRRTNPFAHSDVGSLLLDLGKRLPGSHAYCPSYGSCAYVVLHNDADRGLAFRLAPASAAAAPDDGGTPESKIGPDWFAFEPYEGTDGLARLRRWSALAFFDAAVD